MLISLLLQNPVYFILVAGLLVIAISVHEFSHALASDKLGDPTARINGRLTLNPKAHLDPIGTLFLLVAGFGWGKPVPFDPFNLKDPKRDAAIISFAGPFSNLIMAVLASIIIRILFLIPSFSINIILVNILSLFVYFNLILAIFNLLPFHPLDGFKVVAGLLPKKYYYEWMDLQRYGMIFLFMLIFPIFGRSAIISIVSPVVDFMLSVLIPSGSSGII